MAVGLKKLADECGLSQGTVSNILASRGGYAEETRRMVVEAARRHGYVPSRLATSLREKRSSAVGILMANLTDPYFAELLDALSREISANGLEVMVNLSGLKPGDDVLETYRSFLSWRLRAFLVCASVREVPPPSDLLRVLNATAVIALNNNPWPDCAAVYPERSAFAALALEHLVSLGHRRIGILAYGDDREHYKAIELRNEMHRRGLTLRPQDFLHVPQATTSSATPSEAAVGFELGKRWARLSAGSERPTAAIAWTDMIAARVAAGFTAAGGQIPRDLSIIAYNHTRFGAIAGLPLTAVGVPMDRFARAAVQVMQQAVAARSENKPFAEHVSLQPELIVRQSTGNCPDDATT